MWTEQLSFVLGIVGTVPVILALQDVVIGRTIARRLLRFKPKAPIDLVLSTNARDIEADGVAVSLKTAVGEIWGTAAIAKALGRHYPKKEMRVHLSKQVRNQLDCDLVILGGPLHNETSGDFLTEVNKVYSAGIALEPEKHRLVVGDHYNCADFDLEENADHMPRKDVALILIADNVLAAGSSKAILCGGLTTYGTAAAADFLFRTSLSRNEGRKLRRAVAGGGAAALVVYVIIQDWRVTSVTPVHDPIPLSRSQSIPQAQKV
jgi:hypothetical protein